MSKVRLQSETLPPQKEEEVSPATPESESPAIVPCYYGNELDVSEELVRQGLAAISIKRSKADNILKNPSRKCGTDVLSSRNSFWSVHRPEITKLNVAEQFIKAGARNIETFFHMHVSQHGPHCEHLHDLSSNKRGNSEEDEEELHVIHSTTSDSQVYEDDVDQYIALGGQENRRSIQLSDSDLSPESVVRRSRAEFCVTIGDLGGVFNPPSHRRRSKTRKRKSTSSPSSKGQSVEMYHVEPEASSAQESSTLNPIFENLESREPDLAEEGNKNPELQVTGLTMVLAGVKDAVRESVKSLGVNLVDVQTKGVSHTPSRPSNQEKNEADADVVDIILEPREERIPSLPNKYMPVKDK